MLRIIEIYMNISLTLDGHLKYKINQKTSKGNGIIGNVQRNRVPQTIQLY